MSVASMSLERLRADGYLTTVGMDFSALPLTREEYESLGFVLGAWHEASRWAIGDYLKEGERRFGQEAYQLSESLGISPESRAQYVRVAEAIPLSRRRPELTWSHHRSVAALEPAQQDEWLERAVQNDWTKGVLDAHLHEPKQEGWQLVVEEVVRCARVVCSQAELNGAGYSVPASAIEDLSLALGMER